LFRCCRKELCAKGERTVKEKREKEKEEGDYDAVVGSYYVRPQLWEGGLGIPDAALLGLKLWRPGSTPRKIPNCYGKTRLVADDDGVIIDRYRWM
jgi:hypothetical protein